MADYNYGGPQPLEVAHLSQPFQYDARSLIPAGSDIDHAIRTAIGVADERQAKRDQQEASGIAGQLPTSMDALLSEDNRGALMRLAKLNPDMAKFVVNLAGTNDLNAHKEAADNLQHVSDTFQGFLDIKNPTERNNWLAGQIRDLDAQGQDTSKLSEMIGLTPDQQTLRARANVIAAGDGKTLIDASSAQQMKNLQLQNEQAALLLKQQEIAKNRAAADGGGAGMGNRAEVMFDRVKMAANEAAQAASNIMERPIGQSTGFFGGMTPGTNLLSAPMSALVNKMTPEDVQGYNVMIAGVNRNLASIEAAGLAPSGSLTHSMDAVQFKEGDTEMTKLRKMAEMRQIVEKGLETYTANPKVPQAQKDSLASITQQMQTAIPFTHHDLTVLERQQAKNPNMTISDVLTQKGLGGPGNQRQGAQFSDGMTATNPKTGARVVYKNGQWVPL